MFLTTTSPPSPILGQDFRFLGPHEIHRVACELVGQRDVHPERPGPSLRPLERISSEVILYVDPIRSILLGIVEDEEDWHRLIKPRFIMPHVDVDANTVATLPLF